MQSATANPVNNFALKLTWAVFLVAFAILLGWRFTVGVMHPTESAKQPSFENEQRIARKTTRLNYDFGRVAPGQTLTHSFTIENNTDTDWTIKRIVTNCSCTIAQPQSNVLSRHSAQSIEVTYKAPVDFADDRRVVTVLFDEDESPEYELLVTAQVRRPLSIKKRNLHFAGLPIGMAKTQEIEVENYSNDAWDCLNVEHNQKWVTTKVESIGTLNGIQTWRVIVTANAEQLSAGNHATTLRVSAVPLSQQFVSEIPIVATVVTDVVITPSELFLAEFQQTPKHREQFWFAGNRPSRLRNVVNSK